VFDRSGTAGLRTAINGLLERPAYLDIPELATLAGTRSTLRLVTPTRALGRVARAGPAPSRKPNGYRPLAKSMAGQS